MTNAEEVAAMEITIFTDRVRLDVQTATPGLTFENAWANRVNMSYKDQSFYVVSLDDLVRSRMAAGREVDLADVKILKQSIRKS
jgi:hypothetical protein